MGEAARGPTSLAIPEANRPEEGKSLWRKRRARLVWPAVGIFLLLLGGVLYLEKKAPPIAARLLPESDAIVYFDLTPLRAATGFDPKPVKHDAEYQRFIDATGIQFERDLRQAAFALHRMDNPFGPNGPVAYSSIFVGHFDRTRLAGYMAGIAAARERYAGHDIYDVPVEGRIDRVSILSADTIAVSNTPTAEQIHSILDRNRTAFLPFSGNTLLSRRYAEVPVFSLAWGLGKLGVGLGNDFKLFGFRVPLSVDATFVASLRWAGALRLRIEEIAPSEAAATASADSIGSMLGLVKAAQSALPDALTSADTKALLASAQIEHHSDRAIFTATIPLDLLRSLTSTETKSSGR